MRLVDMLVSAPPTEMLVDKYGQERPVMGAGAHAADIHTCPMRYILDRSASAQCAELMRDPHFPDPRDPVLRLPAQRFWLEYFTEEQSGAEPTRRFGLLADVSADGRSGTMRCFAEDVGELARPISAILHFDLDHLSPRPTGHHRMRQASLPRIDALLDHVHLCPNQDWLQWARDSRQRIDVLLAAMGTNAWSALPIALSFSVLLGATSALLSKRSELDRINAARARRGRPALLEHVEISLRLGSAPAEERGARSGGKLLRRAPRLHFVRGHSVHRSGATYWRSSHFRGDVGPVPITTARVSMGRGAR